MQSNSVSGDGIHQPKTKHKFNDFSKYQQLLISALHVTLNYSYNDILPFIGGCEIPAKEVWLPTKDKKICVHLFFFFLFFFCILRIYMLMHQFLLFFWNILAHYNSRIAKIYPNIFIECVLFLSCIFVVPFVFFLDTFACICVCIGFWRKSSIVWKISYYGWICWVQILLYRYFRF